MFLEYDIPRSRDLKLNLSWLFWETTYLIETEPLKYIRNGEVSIIDMRSFGWNNVDFSSEARDYANAVSGLFPKRLRAIYLVNTNRMITFLLKGAKVVLPKKILERIHLTDRDNLSLLVDPQFLPKRLGGNLDWKLPDDYFKQILSQGTNS